MDSFRVGIQEEFHTDKEERGWTLWQAPCLMVSLERRMPFQSQEGEEWVGGEKRAMKEILT